MSNEVPVLPTAVARRQLPFFWIVDWSGSMAGKKIAALNQAIREAMPDVEKALENHPAVQVMIRCIKFADTAEWHIGPQPVELEKFVWPDLGTDGKTSTAQAIRLLCTELDLERMPRRAVPPVCILISDGFCTEPEKEYEEAIAELEALPWGRRAVRLAVAIGDESEYDETQLLAFTNQKDVGVLKAHNATELVQYIKWASTTASVGAAAGKSSPDEGIGNVLLPASQPMPVISTDPQDVF